MKLVDEILKESEKAESLLEMSNVRAEDTGIANVVIWIGPPDPRHVNRIRVSNIPNKGGRKDSFVLTIPDFKITGKVNKGLITPEILEKIKQWVTLNLDLINGYSEGEDMSTREFLSRIRPV